MNEILEMLPIGWSISPTKERWTIRDEANDFVAKGPTAEELKRILGIEFALQQAFAAVHFAQNLKIVPEA